MTESGPMISDQGVRDEALDPRRSFLVQAPAGSGKTGLLIQRYLALLGVAEKPEEVLAITFTRKAAAEMRERILAVLSDTTTDSRANHGHLSAHEQKTLALAQQAQRQNTAKAWRILDNPNRMQIMTIDAFCARLVAAMPVGSRFGGMPRLVDDASLMYQSAINHYFRDFLNAGIGSDPGFHSGQSLDIVLLQLNNDFERVAALLKTLLGRRDQWLPYVNDEGLIEVEQLNRALVVAIEQDLMPLRNLLSNDLATEITAMAAYAAENLRRSHAESDIARCFGLTELPAADQESLPCWRGIRKLLLTATGGVRKQVTVRDGFPPPSSSKEPDLVARYKEFKARMRDLLARLSDEKEFIQALNRVVDIPERRYDSVDQSFLSALFSVLKHVSAELMLEFQRVGSVDFIELTQSALRALGSDERPTDLGLIFDTRINHILIDEFQDTSRVHLELLRKLTLGWEAQGRSLFVVGDPMQSIYRFRDADVRNFMHIKQHGINALHPEFLQLQSNFRSSAAVVDFNNQAFARIFPKRDDMNMGHVAFHPARASKPPERETSKQTLKYGAPVSLHTYDEGQAAQEARAIVALIHELQAQEPEASIAVLVRSRAQLAGILPGLRQAGVVAGLEGMEQLAQRQEVLDVYALCMALVNPADRQAWLSVLRAPWCGLGLAELELIATAKLHADDTQAGNTHAATPPLIGDLLLDADLLLVLSVNDRERVNALMQAFGIAQTMLYREPLALVLEGLWLRLHGPSCLESQEQHANVESFFKLLRSENVNSVLDSERPLRERLHEYTSTATSQTQQHLQVLTIHMAKGLEFDHVILPGIGRRTRGNDPELLVWQELMDADGLAYLLLSHYHKDTEPSIYNYIRRRNQRLQRAEITRLLYVAMTRCIKAMHIFCATRPDKDTAKDINEDRHKPLANSGSFMQLLGPVLPLIRENVRHTPGTSETPNGPGGFRRLRLKTLKPAYFATDVQLGASDKKISSPELIEYAWAGETAMHVGTVVHLALKQLGAGGLEAWSRASQARKRQHFQRALHSLGIPGAELGEAIGRALAALDKATEDAKGRWLLSGEHTQIENEYPVSGFIEGEYRNYRIDRTFVSGGVRWIIDYKTSSHTGGNLDEFLDNEQERYGRQLENYAILMRAIEDRPVKLGLYFPLMQGWREWDYVPE